jgi:N-acetyl-1-D-myo-inositol-2-amino-2-deoxy-alpha-D-glucopyranoside deacetylase
VTSEPVELLGIRPTRVAFLHAHPDDETLATGHLIAWLTESGCEVHIVTGSRGERGEVVPGPLAALEGTPALVDEREHELERALTALAGDGSAVHHVYLGAPGARAAELPARRYLDSGMRWGADGFAEADGTADTRSLSLAPLAEVTADLVAALDRIRPDLVVGYDERGGYGHPDHVRMREAGFAAARQLALPFAEVVESPAEAEAFHFDAAPDIEADTRVFRRDFAAQHPRVMAALGAHQSQLRVDGDDVVHSGGQRQHVPSVETLRLVR